jgi:hypothetical protein
MTDQNSQGASEHITDIDLSQEMQDSFLEYSYSVALSTRWAKWGFGPTEGTSNRHA